MLTKLCENKKTRKILAIALVMTMLLADFMFFGKNLISYAFKENLENQTTTTQHNNVRFDAYFMDNGGNSVHSAVYDATSDSNKINIYLSVRNIGYLKEAYIDFRDEAGTTDTNYEISGQSVDTTLIQSVNTNLKTITLNCINAGTEAVLQIPISLELAELIDTNKINQDTTVTLRGIYVDENGEEVNISKTVKLNLGWNVETKLNLQQAITKYIPYSENDETNLVVQLSLKVKQDRDDKVMPVKSTELKIKVPEISETLPEKITVVAGSTMATNGNKVEFSAEDWQYNEDEKTITITTRGHEENGTVWAGAGTDEYYITYVYKDIDTQSQEGIILPCEAMAKMNLYTPSGIETKEAESIGNAILNEKVGELVSYSIQANQDEISKGKMYANYNTETKTYNTEYTSTIKANISNYEIVDGISMQLQNDTFIGAEASYATKYNGINYANINEIVINKNQMQNLLGEEGYINIIDDKSNTYVINNETQDTNGNYIINFEEGIGNLQIRTTKPIADGILQINVAKSVSKDLPYLKEQVKQFEQLKLNMVGTTTYIENIAGNNAYAVSSEDIITLTETSTNATLQINDTTYTTMADNKNVEMTIVLNNNVETSDLYKNAVFTLNLPKYIEDIEVTTGNILYTSGLEIDYIEKKNTENGIVLVLYTKGAETTFSDGVFTNGANIVLNTNIKVDMLAPNVSDKITMTYTNESAVSYKDDLAYSEVPVQFISPEEMVTFNSVLSSGIEATSTEGNEQIAKLQILDSEKIATMKISILNKYPNICNNIRILGRTPFEGNKEILTGNDLGTTFNAKVISEIYTNGIPAEVYYSANGDASEDLNDISNGWTTDMLSLEEVKSYLIVLPNYEMQVGEQLEFSYDCQIPENLEHNESAYGTYIVYFDTVTAYTLQNRARAARVGLSTGIGANIEMITKAIYQGKEITGTDTVKEYQTVTYKTTISNTGTVDATNVTLTSTIENGTVISANDATINGQTITWNFDTIKAGETKTVEYDVKIIRKIVNIKIKNDINLTAENFEGNIEESIENTMEQAELTVEIRTEKTELINNYETYMRIVIQNISDKTINNIVLKQEIPEGIEYIAKNDAIEYNDDSKTISIKIDKLDPNEVLYKRIDVKTNIPNNAKVLKIDNQAVATGDEIDTYYSNVLELTVKSTVLDISINSSLPSGSYIKEGNTLEITGKLQNIGAIQSPNATASIEIPKEFEVSEAKYTLQDGTEGKLKSTKDGNRYILTALDVGKGVTFTIKGTPTLGRGLTEKEINFVATASDAYRNEITSNTLKYIIEKDNQSGGNAGNNPSNPTDPTNPNQNTNTYRITGVAWLDENEDGQRQATEKLIPNVSVLLIDSNGVIVADPTNGTAKQTTTDSKGQYTFSNIPQGKYMVVFEYDSAHYNVTEYKKFGLTEDLTSKAKQAKISKDGKESIAGITDIITITDSSKANINIGLVEKEKFDLSLTKQLTTVTVANSGGTTTYDFTNTKLGKIDIPGKYLNSTTVTLQYKIIIKNEGAIAGYAKNIVDYISNDLNFDSSKNQNWHMGQDGNLYCNALANTIINPGESKEVTLILTKRMNENNTGIVTNRAEIYEDYNELGYSDYNSTPANTSQQENDYDAVDVIITVKTGQVAIYITITLISIAIIGAGAYFINKKVLKGGKI